VDVLARRVDRKAFRYQCLYHHLRLGVSRWAVDDEALALAREHFVQFVCYQFVVIAYNELPILMHTKEVTGRE
jgi:hypothetical protein